MMLRRVKISWLCVAFGLGILLIIAGIQHIDNICYRQSLEACKNLWHNLKTEDRQDSQLQLIPTKPYDGLPNFEKILENARSEIKFELRNYNFSHSGAHKLDDLLIESGGRPVRSIIISTWRSGTTFLGGVLDAMPGSFYHYEPLLKYGVIQIRGPPLANKAISELTSMLKCDYSGMEDYFEYEKTHLHQFTQSKRLWNGCKNNKNLCFDANFTAAFCKLFPFQSMKVCRLRLHLAKDILENNELNVKVMLLIRDPRGVLHSRQHLSFCSKNADCSKPDLLCADMVSDYEAARRFSQMYPERFMVIRFEELVADLNVTIVQLLKFLRLSSVQSIEEFLQTHTNVDIFGFASTFRVTRNVPFRWKHALDFDYVEKLQEVCKEAMELWGYKLAHNASHMASKDFNPVKPYSLSQGL